ncbi:hypothetical protein FGIG_11699 [Fasciola gigantica]|uniref:Uncharacterized protein n=1 Tax=Fasciola gigantica TaxID=46835 RepID=A0A504Y5N4_FASGI|nr:hypothetical protein FGIG_11699 [Fasciola gigantica]
MASKSPFYAVLSAIRALLNQCSDANKGGGCDLSHEIVGPKNRVSVSRTDKPLLPTCIFHRCRPADSSNDRAPSMADRLITVGLRITNLILPVLAHAAPEGHVPDDDGNYYYNNDDCLEISPEPAEILSEHDVDQTKQYPEYLTICCWRSVRELATVLGYCLPRIGRQLVADCTPSDEPDAVSTLGLSHAQDILGAVWVVNNKDGSLTVNTVHRLFTVIEQTFKHCANECSDEIVTARWSCALQRCVVALNVARTLLRSSVLMQPTAEFTERAICLAIDGLGCADWALRNSSGLLFSTLMERLFGVNRSRDVTSRKNCLSSTNFFKLYPNLKEHMVRTLKCTTSDLRCAASCDIRIRQIAARALLSLIPTNRLPMVTLRYIQELDCLVHSSICCPSVVSDGSASFSRSNLTHGLLLQVNAQHFSM